MKLQSSSLKMNTFKEMNLPEAMYTALQKMQITKPTPVQVQAIPLALQGSDLIAVAQTGSGKTLAFALPVLNHLNNKPESRALILAPSREMAQQIYKVFLELCKDMPVSICLAIGGTTGSKQINQMKKNPRIIVATPGRLNDHLEKNKLLLQAVEVVVLDEADRMLDMGFAPQLKLINQTLRGEWQTLMFSASFGSSVESMARVFMRDTAFMIRSDKAEAPVESLKQKVLLIDRAQKDDRLLDELNATKGGVIIFVGDQAQSEYLGKYLKEYGYSVDFIHGGLSQGQRNRVVREFRAAEIRIMVTTDLLARGLDVPHVEHVVSFDLPFSAEDFLHRIGRTARAGRAGTAITFVTPLDARKFNEIKPYLQGAEEVKVDKDFNFLQRAPSNFKIREEQDTKKRVDRYAGKPRTGRHAKPGAKRTFTAKASDRNDSKQGDRPSRAEKPAGKSFAKPSFNGSQRKPAYKPTTAGGGKSSGRR